MHVQHSRVVARKSPTVGAVIIGDEILSGKVDDTNSSVLIGVLRRRGAALSRLVVVGDHPAEISREVRHSSDAFDFVITSGGVGPTHDDRTMAGIAHAFDVPVVRHPNLEALIHAHLGTRVNDAALKMAEVPEGATLLTTDRFPLVRFRNIFVLPGVPSIFRRKLEFVARALQGTPSVVERVVLGCYESDVAQDLASVHDRHGLVSVGSYPRDEDGRDVVLVTLESRSGAAAAAALEDLLHRLPAGVVLRVESEGLRS